ncbi:MAG: dTDP-4-dehydrorhamnose 3,5-epimerase family protein [Candidatus Polarisedimenticolia bacterium]|nr:dTDP-4-dehydrorhamnose 3,5-epimerase family protein [bacterium]
MDAKGYAGAGRKTKVEGVVVVPLEAHVDERGYLIEILRAVDPHFTKFGQVYLVGDMARGAVRAFHKHERLWDWFFIGHGSAKFAVRDDRKESPTYEAMDTIVIGDRNPSLIVVPPGVYHGWMALEDDTQLISIGSEVYDREHPDEVRVPPDSWGYDWSIKGR